MVDTQQLAAALGHALERGQLTAWFQPQYDLLTDELVGVEALCRWHHPTWGTIAPSSFIPIAEEDGSIEEIGRFMAVEAISAMRAWRIDVSVNVSPTQLEDSSFAVWLEQRMRSVRRPARRLTLEITEGRHLDDVPALVGRLDRLRAIGLGIAIDDFGAGQASLTQLKRLHATELKIDRALVIDDSPEASEVVAAAVAVAHDAGIRVVAEGIETPDQLDRIARLGCDRAQGYLLGRPVPRPEMEELVAQR